VHFLEPCTIVADMYVQTFAKTDLPKEHRVLKEGDMSTMDHKPDRYDFAYFASRESSSDIQLMMLVQAQHPHRRGRHCEEGHSRLKVAAQWTIVTSTFS
jgi:hypothetical protein